MDPASWKLTGMAKLSPTIQADACSLKLIGELTIQVFFTSGLWGGLSRGSFSTSGLWGGLSTQEFMLTIWLLLLKERRDHSRLCFHVQRSVMMRKILESVSLPVIM